MNHFISDVPHVVGILLVQDEKFFHFSLHNLGERLHFFIDGPLYKRRFHVNFISYAVGDDPGELGQLYPVFTLLLGEILLKNKYTL